MSEVLVKQLKEFTDEVDLKLKKIDGQVEENGKASKDDYEGLKSVLEKEREAREKLQKHVDSVEALAKKSGSNGGYPQESFKGALHKALTEKKDELSNWKNRKNISFELDVKAVGNMGSATNLTGEVVAPDRRPGLVDVPVNQTHIRQFMTVGNTTSNLIRYVRENGVGEGTPGMVAEGGLKPQIDFDLSIQDAPVRKIAAHVRLPEEMIEDIPYLMSFITNRGVNRLKNVEDAQLLYGDGTGNNLTGVTTVASAFAAGTLIVPTPQNFDVIRAAMKQIRVAEYQATAVMMSPQDLATTELTKDANGLYIITNVMQNGIPSLWRLPVIESTQIATGKFLLGDFVRGAEILDRAGVSVRMYDQDQDNAIRNLVTIVIEERLAFPIYRPAAFVYGDFAAAKTDLTS